MEVKGFKNTKNLKYSGKKNVAYSKKHTNSKENVVMNKRKNVEEVKKVDYNDIPDSVYEFSGLNELQKRKSKPNKAENEKFLKHLYIIKNGQKIEEFSDENDRFEELEQNNIQLEENKNNIIEKEVEDNKKQEQSLEKNQETKEKTLYEIEEEKIAKNKENANEKKQGKHQEEKTSFLKKICIHPEDFENSFKNWFDSNKRFAFLVALIVGIITHITFLTNMIMSQDGLWNSIGYEETTKWEISLGRWGILIADKIVDNLAIPNATGIISILLISISTVLIIDLLKLENKITIFLVSCAMVVSPVLTGTLLYVYTSVAYCLSMLLSVITVYLIFNEKHKILNIVIAIIVFTFSLGIYQSYIGVTIGLTAIKLIRDLLEKKELKLFFIHGIIMCIVVILGGILYSFVTEIILEKLDVEMSTYKGMENISIQNTINNLKTSIPKAYKDFKDFYFSDEIVTNTNFSRQRIYKVMFLTAAILELIIIISKKIWKEPFRLLFIIIMNLILPVALNCVLLLTTETTTYVLTSYQMMLIIPYIAVICEIAGKNYTCIFKWITLLSIFLVVFTYYLSDNASYIALELTYNQAIAVSNRILERIEIDENYLPERSVMIVGVLQDQSLMFSKRSNIYDYTTSYLFSMPAIHGTYSGMEGTWQKFINIYLGTRVVYCSRDDYKNIINTEEYKEMNTYPAQNSVRMINDVMVVKLSEDTPMP